MLWSALGETLPQAAAIALSPIPIVLAIVFVTSARGRTNGPAFAVGWTLAIAAITAGSYALATVSQAASPSESETRGSLAQLMLGLVLAALAVRAWRKRPRQGERAPEPEILAKVETMSAGRAFVLGVVAAANPKTVPLAISSGASMAQTIASGAHGHVAVALFALGASSTVALVLFAQLAGGDPARQSLEGIKARLLAHRSAISIVLLIVLATKMLGAGLALGDRRAADRGAPSSQAETEIREHAVVGAQRCGGAQRTFAS